ncbi:hypothetical protein MKQ70_16645 [Chitinophaga sedimenti]|uniref:hypothetical protein n=1 Tax=Chitinophaga sedimenti TaxID=2033606 RepID=UPI002002B4F3|nr:hypothetical protein [Chitinophaga sedimenti]MCK7556557.1 hypothetical protein [Chitinophaga sedimenti]
MHSYENNIPGIWGNAFFVPAGVHWLRNNKGAVVLIGETLNEKNLEEFVKSYWGYVVIITVWKTHEIINSEGESMKKRLRKYTPNMRDRIDLLQGLPNSEVVIPNFDHYSKELGLSHWFYFRDFEFALSPSELDQTTYRIMTELGRIYTSSLKLSVKEDFETITRIIWELMANTNEHATKDHLNEATLAPNTRGLYFKIHESNKINLVTNASDEPGLQHYYESALQEGENKIRILEISVFDSGPGLVKRFLGRAWKEHADLTEDVTTVKQCLIRGQSSVKGPDSMKKGYGLDDVLQLLDKKQGFLKIRTGRISLYRNLIAAPYVATKFPQEVELCDTQTQSANNFTEYPWMEGTQITMAYPLT